MPVANHENFEFNQVIFKALLKLKIEKLPVLYITHQICFRFSDICFIHVLKCYHLVEKNSKYFAISVYRSFRLRRWIKSLKTKNKKNKKTALLKQQKSFICMLEKLKYRIQKKTKGETTFCAHQIHFCQIRERMFKLI